MTDKPPCAWIADKKICGKLACDKQGPCDGFEVSKGALAGEAIRKRRQELRAIGHHNLVMASVFASLPRHRPENMRNEMQLPSPRRYSDAGIFDPECHRLAEYFLQGDPRCNDPEVHKKLVAVLATDVQRAVEDFFLAAPKI